MSDIKINNIKIDSLQTRLNESLQQAGLFRALVVETNGNRVLLDTAFGQVRGLAPDKLLKGDEILARLLPGKSDPTIKIELTQTSRQELPQKIADQLSRLTSSALPQAIKVLAHTTDKTLVQLDQKTYTIPRQALLEKGETLLLKLSTNNKVELLRVNPQNILKNALSNLLPRTVNAGSTTDLASLQKLASDFLQLKPANTHNHQTSVHIDKVSLQSIIDQAVNGQKENPGANAKKETSLASSTLNSQKEQPINLIKQLLTALSQPLAKVESFKAGSLQQILGMLSLLKSAAPANSSNRFSSIPDSIIELHSAIKNSPDNFKLLLRQIIESNAGENKTSMHDAAMADSSNALKAELLQQLEQSLSQLLTQKSGMRLNQELNQPIQINLNIPLQLNNETTSLKLKIKQQKSSDVDDQQHWEISLAFEFALLGLISTNILLQDTKLSANFWAEKSDTKQLIDTHMNQFKNQLKKSGFELGFFDCFIGKPVEQDDKVKPVKDNLVDINV